jgi:hypothetical protein
LLGYENSRNFRSQFLRGIRADSRYLGELLSERLAGSQKIVINRGETKLLTENPAAIEESVGKV